MHVTALLCIRNLMLWNDLLCEQMEALHNTWGDV